MVVQTPDVFGHLHDLRPIAEKAHAPRALLIAVFTEPSRPALSPRPETMGADIVVGEGHRRQRAISSAPFYVGLFATRPGVRPPDAGRLAGETAGRGGSGAVSC
ncbi:MAG: hypothetical protein M5U33_03365 [Pseudorhodoplanes sp.]|nr:hypothetical protein [Pseudorhodoplanes sp.]